MQAYDDCQLSGDRQRATPTPITATRTDLVRADDSPVPHVPAHPLFRLPQCDWQPCVPGLAATSPAFPGLCSSYFNLRTQYANGLPYAVDPWSCRQTRRDDRLGPVILPAFLDWLRPYINTAGRMRIPPRCRRRASRDHPRPALPGDRVYAQPPGGAAGLVLSPGWLAAPATHLHGGDGVGVGPRPPATGGGVRLNGRGKRQKPQMIRWRCGQAP